MKKYCQDCNQPTDYVGAKPKFCSNCGTPFEGAAKRAEPVVAAQVPRTKVFDRLDVEIVAFKHAGVSLKDTILSGLDGPREVQRPVERDLARIREDWRKEASSGRIEDLIEIDEEIKKEE